MSIFERLKKRAAFPVGDTGLHIRELTFRQLDQVKALADGELQTWLTLAFCLVDEHGEPAFRAAAEESCEQLAARVKLEGCDFITAGVLNQIMQAMTRLSTPANQDTLTKN